MRDVMSDAALDSIDISMAQEFSFDDYSGYAAIKSYSNKSSRLDILLETATRRLLTDDEKAEIRSFIDPNGE